MQLVQDLSGGLADPIDVERFYEEAVLRLAARGVTATVQLIETSDGVGTYTLPERSVNLLGVFYGNRQLARATLNELEWHDPRWRDRLGSPLVFVTATEEAKDFRLYPAPDASSKDFIFLVGSPLGVDLPEQTAAAVVSETRDDLPEWFDLPLAALVLGREFAKESPHRDAVLAKAWNELGEALVTVVS